MNILNQAKIYFYINECNYINLQRLVYNSNENNEILSEYIINKFSKKKNAICGFDLVKLLGCMDDNFILKTIEHLINEPNFSYKCFELILKSKKLNSAIKLNRNKYIKFYINEMDFMGIIRLYDHENITEEDKKYIETTLYSKILNAKNAYNFALAQQILGIEIISKKAIEKAIINSCEAKYIYGLMELREYNKNKLINKLAEIKELDSVNKKYFLIAISEYYASEISKISLGDFIEELVISGLTPKDNTMIITKASNAIAVMKNENKKVTLYSDDDEFKSDKTKKYNTLY